jgi:hypothetical protein
VKHQYVGDINDYRKYALLRALLAAGINRIGVCWMLTPSDGRSDGEKLAYLSRPNEYRSFDSELFDVLVRAAAEPDRRRLQSIEESGAISNADFFNEILLDDHSSRVAYMEQCLGALANADLIFFDPDTGLEVLLAKGRRNSSKYLYLDEVTAFYRSNKSLLIYQHFPRIKRSAFLSSCADRLRVAAPSCAIWTFTTAHVAFFLLVHPESPARVAVAAIDACGRLDPSFIRGEYLPRAAAPAAARSDN